jgi:hypothetical protein
MVQRIVVTIALAALTGLTAAGCGGSATDRPRGPHWNDKALASVRAAERRVGGFDASERSAYRRGVQYIIARHQRIGSFTIMQVVEQQRARDDAARKAIVAQRERAAAAKQRAEEQRRRAAEAAAYREAHRDYCAEALADEKLAAASSTSKRRSYAAAVAGLAANERCSDAESRLVNQGYLLSMKAFAEHDLGTGDWRTDMNQANALLVSCQTEPDLYGTKIGASCETQEQYNIRATTNWEIND